MRLGEVVAEDTSALVLQTYSSSCLQEGAVTPSHNMQNGILRHIKFDTAYSMLRSHLAASTDLSTPLGFLALLL